VIPDFRQPGALADNKPGVESAIPPGQPMRNTPHPGMSRHSVWRRRTGCHIPAQASAIGDWRLAIFSPFGPLRPLSPFHPHATPPDTSHPTVTGHGPPLTFGISNLKCAIISVSALVAPKPDEGGFPPCRPGALTRRCERLGASMISLLQGIFTVVGRGEGEARRRTFRPLVWLESTGFQCELVTRKAGEAPIDV